MEKMLNEQSWKLEEIVADAVLTDQGEQGHRHEREEVGKDGGDENGLAQRRGGVPSCP